MPREWTDEPARCRTARVPADVSHRKKWRLTLGLLDALADWKLTPPVVVADAGYGASTPFRPAVEDRILSYVGLADGQEGRPSRGRGAGPAGLWRARTTDAAA
ncbi:transposase [Streptomyces sp. NPDC021012]|uniref:transposase n=1 Tax=Streptomyces sp. NPDC021012 TaxID=3365107 RepID=UPI0037A1D5B4